ncbi:PilT/PilU family type 4a pilus ATPase [Photobacterium galatheae]|uniref:Twitching motility protein PilT n=1 Tax=Photobacterium galatheae TaxID=1654360 RepID=A0A066RQS0_9GAMM|nr:PilT/PilU family type 4a pilus ATPase [Photobacterium galatheae]KDM92669.1 twitching motility protein PilT [Photobacterium galatheae]MCM0149413.1 PilT/PilU family type 4a pilus ATPase [Photobacterium galatheae]
MELASMLTQMVAAQASDLYLTVSAPSQLKIDGQLQASGQALTAEAVEHLCRQAMSPEQWQTFVASKEANFALVRDGHRFRLSAFWQREQPGMVIRRIESIIPDVDALTLPEPMKALALAKRGLVLVVGATGSGKSTSMAALTGYRNRNRSGHILTVEDPIEFIHQHGCCIVTQREVGLDTESYEVALKNSLRQAPDMILIGEIRNQETMEYALNFAETGHLCMATLHANNANQALERILHLVPSERREQLLFDLSLNLKGILAQQLIPDANGTGRHAAFELLINTPRISDLIRRNALHELKETMAKGKEQGMLTFDQSLFALYQAGKISEADALAHADSANDVRLMIKLGQSGQTEPGHSLAGVSIRFD